MSPGLAVIQGLALIIFCRMQMWEEIIFDIFQVLAESPT
jgi:hypothetical protein